MDCGTSVVKYILFLFNTLVSIIGILGIVHGALILNSLRIIEINGQTVFPMEAIMPMVLITIGSIVVFISFLGCCGAIRESVCMTMTYAVFMLILLILQLTIVVLLFTNKENFSNAMGAVIDQAWEPENREAGVFEGIQKWLHCCGKDSAADYVLIGKIPPQSCCAGDNCLNPLNLYSGCRGKFQNFMAGNTETSKHVGIGLIVIELVGFIFACCLANNIRNYKRRNDY